jgi:hypothetical protein
VAKSSMFILQAVPNVPPFGIGDDNMTYLVDNRFLFPYFMQTPLRKFRNKDKD